VILLMKYKTNINVKFMFLNRAKFFEICQERFDEILTLVVLIMGLVVTMVHIFFSDDNDGPSIKKREI
jgi:hypothetical protein